jgi:BirA family biotin operon repressor/biotin-[acetyl-CoA-carboxylase] ligase
VSLGNPRVHYRETASTNLDARALALAGAPHGTLVTAALQLDGRGRQGRRWHAPADEALLCSVIVREPPPLLPIAAGVAVAAVVGEGAMLKWPNDVLLDGRKVAGILVEGRPQERWSIIGIGINVAVTLEALPAELRDRAGTLGRGREAIEPTLAELLVSLEHWLHEPTDAVLAAWRPRDALIGKAVQWSAGSGIGGGIDERGRLLIRTDDGAQALDAGEIHLAPNR